MTKDEIINKLINDEFNRKPQKGGFFPLPERKEKGVTDFKKVCKDNEHNPPRHLHIPQGQGYKHICPACGYTQIVIPPQITM